MERSNRPPSHSTTTGSQRRAADRRHTCRAEEHRAEGVRSRPLAAGLAVTADGRRLVVANHYNDSISVIDLSAGVVTARSTCGPAEAVDQAVLLAASTRIGWQSWGTRPRMSRACETVRSWLSTCPARVPR